MFPFNVRVYGLLINDKNEVLVSDEYEHGMYITKFPGGGLEFGESTIECIRREFMEELNQETEVTGHFYTTDFFIESAFDKSHQLISIYYEIKITEPLKVSISKTKFDFAELKEGTQSFRWLDAKNISDKEMTFPVDKKVAEMLREIYSE